MVKQRIRIVFIFWSDVEEKLKSFVIMFCSAGNLLLCIIMQMWLQLSMRSVVGFYKFIAKLASALLVMNFGSTYLEAQWHSEMVKDLKKTFRTSINFLYKDWVWYYCRKNCSNLKLNVIFIMAILYQKLHFKKMVLAHLLLFLQPRFIMTRWKR